MGGMGWDVGGRFKREGTYVYLWLIHVDIWQNPNQYCKALTLQLKINFLKIVNSFKVGSLIPPGHFYFSLVAFSGKGDHIHSSACSLLLHPTL